MAYDLVLADRVRRALVDADATEKKMFGGVAWMVGGYMTCGIVGEDLMVRVGPEANDAALARPHVRPMDFTGRPMVGMVYVAPAGVTSEPELRDWIDRAVGYAREQPPKVKPAKRPA